MKKDPLYNYFIAYLKNRLHNSQISEGEFSMMKISYSFLEKFKQELKINKSFNNKIMKLYSIEMRDKKIEDILLK